MMRRFSILIVAALAAIWASAPALAAEKRRVVASLPDLAAIAREVGGDRVLVTSLAVPTQNPHHVDARPHLVLALNRADLLIHAGLELEIGWLPTLIRGSRNPRIYPGTSGNLDASSVVRIKDIPPGKVDRTMGDLHSGGNPHYLTDPRNGGLVAVAVAERLAGLDPEGAQEYWSRAANLNKRAQELAKRDAARFRSLPEARKRIVTYHRSLSYLADWLGLTMVEALEPKAGIPPTPVHIARVMAVIKERQVPAIVQEAFHPTRTSEVVAARSGAKLLVLPGFPDFDKGQDYLDYVGKLADTLYATLGEAP